MSSPDQGFAPIVGESPRVLVLGTLPSQRSLQAAQYYGNPQNAFWWIMSRLLDFDLSLSYQERSHILADHGIAVWDVIHSAIRPGSLDAAIETDTIKTNDFESFFRQHPTLKLLAFNGKAAQALFRKHVTINWCGDTQSMPSTSPAYAAMRREQKLEKWRTMLAYL